MCASEVIYGNLLVDSAYASNRSEMLIFTKWRCIRT